MLRIMFCLLAFMATRDSYAQAPDISYQTPFSFTVGVPITPVSPTNAGGPVPATVFSQVTTFAGSTTAGPANGIGAAAGFNRPTGLARDAAGNLYVADAGNNQIRKITPGGLVTTFAGSGAVGSADGLGILASFSEPTGLCIDKQGNLYVTDKNSHIIRKITPAGFVTTIAGKAGVTGQTNAQGEAARFNNPLAIAVDDAGFLYVADYANNMIRGIAPDGTVRTIAGSTNAGNGVVSDADKQGTAATFRVPSAIAVTPDGKKIYVGESSYIRTIDVDGNVVSVVGSFFAGNYDGTYRGARVNQPIGLTIDAANTIFIGDAGNNLIRRFDAQGQVTTLAGFTPGYADGIGAAARFNGAAGVAISPNGDLYVADPGNNTIRKVITTGYYIAPNLPPGLSFDPKTGTISGTPTEKLQASPFSVFAYNTTGKNAITITIEVRLPGLIKQTLTLPPLPAKKERDLDFNTNASSSNPSIPLIYTSSDTQVATISDGKIHIVGPGTTTITVFQPGSTDYEEAVPVSQDLVVAADPLPIKYPTVTPKGPPILLPLPSGGTYKAKFADVATITADPAEQPPVIILGNGSFNCSSVGPQVVSITAGYGPDPANPINAEFNAPSNLTIDANGDIFIADPGNYMIRELSAANRVTTFAGSGQVGSLDGKNTVAQFSRGLQSMASDINGNVYVCDVLNKLVRKISPKGDVTSFATAALKAANGGVQVDVRAIAISPAGGIFIADQSRIYQVSNDGNNATVFAGNTLQANVSGTGVAAGFSGIVGLTFDQSGTMYASTSDNNYVNTVRKITPAAVVTTLNTTTASSVHFKQLVVDSKGTVFVASADNKIYQVINGQLTVYTGSVAGDAEGATNEALFSNPQGIAIDAADNLYIADSDNHKIKKITPGGITTTIAGNGHPGHVDNTNVSNAKTINVAVNITSPVLFTTTFADVTVPVTNCQALVPDFTKDAKAISYCSSNVIIKQSPAAGTPMVIGMPVSITLTADDDLSSNDRATATFKATAASAALPTIKISPEGGVGTCEGKEVTFTATFTNGGVAPALQWQVNGVNVAATTATFTSSSFVNGDKVTCIITNNDGCAPVSVTSAFVSIDLIPSTSATISIVPSVTDAVCPSTEITFTATITGVGVNDNPAYEWRVNNIIAGTNSHLFTTTALVNGDVVTCTLASGGLCLVNPLVQSNRSIAMVKTIAECSIVINNTFTPNGDGVNDFWNLPVLQGYPGCSVIVFNRYGKQVFQSIGYSKPWDANYNGKPLPSGTYYYIIDTKTGIPALSGSVTILR
ncbi:T9SS type B sorting domain-containing protein [Mucilaginibacter glaciei]|nr:gliding motility-associated C-terminal domain-containing protein [Mucilaginibacter glaciei]